MKLWALFGKDTKRRLTDKPSVPQRTLNPPPPPPPQPCVPVSPWPVPAGTLQRPLYGAVVVADLPPRPRETPPGASQNELHPRWVKLALESGAGLPIPPGGSPPNAPAERPSQQADPPRRPPPATPGDVSLQRFRWPRTPAEEEEELQTALALSRITAPLNPSAPHLPEGGGGGGSHNLTPPVPDRTDDSTWAAGHCSLLLVDLPQKDSSNSGGDGRPLGLRHGHTVSAWEGESLWTLPEGPHPLHLHPSALSREATLSPDASQLPPAPAQDQGLSPVPGVLLTASAPLANPSATSVHSFDDEVDVGRPSSDALGGRAPHQPPDFRDPGSRGVPWVDRYVQPGTYPGGPGDQGVPWGQGGGAGGSHGVTPLTPCRSGSMNSRVQGNREPQWGASQSLGRSEDGSAMARRGGSSVEGWIGDAAHTHPRHTPPSAYERSSTPTAASLDRGSSTGVTVCSPASESRGPGSLRPEHSETAGKSRAQADAQKGRSEGSVAAPSSKRSDGDKEEASNGRLGLCSICCGAEANAVCVPCGHVCGCLACLLQVRKLQGHCPVCRSTILHVTQVYLTP